MEMLLGPVRVIVGGWGEGGGGGGRHAPSARRGAVMDVQKECMTHYYSVTNFYSVPIRPEHQPESRPIAALRQQDTRHKKTMAGNRERMYPNRVKKSSPTNQMAMNTGSHNVVCFVMYCPCHETDHVVRITWEARTNP